MAPSNPGSPAGAGGGRPQSPSVSGSNSNSSSNGAGKGKGILTASTPASSSEGNTLASINPVDPLGCAAAPGSSSTGSGSTAEGAAAAGSAPVSAPSTVALHQLVTGCKVFVERPAPEEPRKAEILSIRQRKPPRPPRNKDGTLARPPPEEAPKPILEYYIHYVEFNKRLDEWVSSSRLLLSRPVEWPVPKGDGAHSSHGHGPASAGHGSSTPTPPQQKRPAKAGDQGLRKTAIKQAASKAGQQGQKTPASDKKDKRKKKLTGAAATAKATKAAGVTGTPGTSGTATPARSGSIGEDGDDSMFTMNIDSPSTRSVSVNLDRESSADVQEGTTPKEGTPDVEDSSMALDEDGDDAQQAKQEEVDENDESKDDAGGAVIAVEVMDENEDGEDDVDPNEVAGPTHLEKQATFSKEQEIEQLRTHGSMTQSVHEVSRVKNLDKIQMGAHEVEAWYFSPYPVEYAHIPTLYICEFCLLFYGSPKQLERHRKKCTLLHPPGNEIYRHEEISFYEIDGKKQKTWCRNLCLLSKCFLDHKTLYYDVDPFLFYVMAKRDDQGVHLIGYFSKEKESTENYNVACILTLPQHQRHGYGKLLIEFSYELSKKEQRTGSPEKPLSDLGLLSYRAYWQEIIVDFILEMKGKGIDTVSIDDIANKTAILQADIMHTAQTLQMLKFYQNQYVLCLSDALIEQSERIKKKKRRRINPEALVWTPPKFSKAQLNFGY